MIIEKQLPNLVKEWNELYGMFKISKRIEKSEVIGPLIQKHCYDKELVKKIIRKYGRHEGSDEVTHPTIMTILKELEELK